MTNKKQIIMTPEQKALFDALTTLQQQIALNSISGMSNIDSYRNSEGKAKTQEAQDAGASEILNNPKVKAFIDAMKETAVSNAVMSRQEMLESLSVISRSSLNDLIEWSEVVVTDASGEKVKQAVWSVKESAKLDPDAMSTIAELTAGRDGIKIKQHSKLSAMKQLAELAGYDAPTKSEVKNVTDDGSNEW